MKDYYCYNCDEEFDGDDIAWYNDIPVCPNCNEKLEE